MLRGAACQPGAGAGTNRAWRGRPARGQGCRCRMGRTRRHGGGKGPDPSSRGDRLRGLDRHDDARQSHIHASISSPPPAAKTRHATQEAIVLLSRRACVEAGNPAPTSIFPQSGRSPRVLTFCPMWRVHAAAHSIYEGKIMPTADSTRSIWSHGFFITIIGLLFLAGPLPAPPRPCPSHWTTCR